MKGLTDKEWVELGEKGQKALCESVEKWANICLGQEVDKGPGNCPLCKLYFSMEDHDGKGRACRACLIYSVTGMYGCAGSPYEAWKLHHMLKHSNQRPMRIQCPECLRLAKEEMMFLWGLVSAMNEPWDLLRMVYNARNVEYDVVFGEKEEITRLNKKIASLEKKLAQAREKNRNQARALRDLNDKAHGQAYWRKQAEILKRELDEWTTGMITTGMQKELEAAKQVIPKDTTEKNPRILVYSTDGATMSFHKCISKARLDALEKIYTAARDSGLWNIAGTIKAYEMIVKEDNC